MDESIGPTWRYESFYYIYGCVYLAPTCRRFLPKQKPGRTRTMGTEATTVQSGAGEMLIGSLLTDSTDTPADLLVITQPPVTVPSG